MLDELMVKLYKLVSTYTKSDSVNAEVAVENTAIAPLVKDRK